MGFDSVINRGEYFSDHYLAEVLPATLKKGVFKEWGEREAEETRRVTAARENPNATEVERRRRRVTPRAGLAGYRTVYFDERSALSGVAERLEAGERLRDGEAAEHTERLHRLHRELLTALGYGPKDEPLTAHFAHGEDTMDVRLALHEPTVAAIECGWAPDVDAAMDPAGAGWLLDPVRLSGSESVDLGAKLVSWLFAREEGLRYVLVLVGGVVILADRAVWGEGRYLGVSLDTALDRNDRDELGTIAALLGAEALLPSEDGSGDALAGLVESSHQHAVGVSKELRQGLQRSVELIANEVLAQLREQRVSPHAIDTGTGRTFADELARQSLRYLYRILFLLYAEARPELGVVPAKDEAYVRGYSMARLGDLVVNDLQGEEARRSTHLYESLDLLFRMVNEGHNQRGYVLSEEEATGLSEGDGLRFEPLKADLFDPARTHLIGEGLVHPDDDPDEPEMPRLDTRLRNATLHRVLRMLMLSRGSRKGRGGFISYAQLGINQLGAVYEGLMSYTGRIAEETLYEAAKNGDPRDGSWLVPESKVDDYPADVWVRELDEDGRPTEEPRKYRAGQFVYRLAGRDRETSASYYTPESLTRLTVQLTLRERLDQNGEQTPARELLEWTICEPALGSGAFLNEAINQVAAEYLKRAQEERGEELDPERYALELQKVKAYIALHRAYGVDLNETAVELAEVSLWLNVMHPGLQAPWFGLHLRRGNSLVGAGRRLYSPEQVKSGEWLKSAPKDVPFRDGEIPEGYIHHFLLPAQGWGSVAGEKVAKELAPEDTAKLNAWRKLMRKRPKSGNGKATQLKRLQALSRRVEYWWDFVVRRLELSEREISRWIKVYGADWIDEPENPISREEVRENLEAVGKPYWRLKTVMDAWCALWFWPVQEAGLLDGSDKVYEGLDRSREASSAGNTQKSAPPKSLSIADLDGWLAFAEAILGSHDAGKDSLFAEKITSLQDLDLQEENLPGTLGTMKTELLGERFPWLHAAEKISRQYGFFHWELNYAHLFKRGKGFDIQVGNPPWVRPNWNEDDVLAESEPWFKLARRVTADRRKVRKEQLIERREVRSYILGELVRTSGLSEFLSNASTYATISGTRPDLYRAFMILVWGNSGGLGVAGMVHPDTHFSGVREGELRSLAYKRLRVHVHFRNVGNWAFPEPVNRNTEFGLHVYGPVQNIRFTSLNWIFSPSVVLPSLGHDGVGAVPGTRLEGAWDLRPHSSRLIHVDENLLATWKRVVNYDGLEISHTPLLYPVTTNESGALLQLGDYGYRLGEQGPLIARGLDEGAARRAGLIKWDTGEVGALDDLIIQGPHFGLSAPFSKRPDIPCRNNHDWSPLDLSNLPDDFVPMANYKISSSRERFFSMQENWAGKSYSKYYRLAWRRMIPFNTERSLYVSIVPPGPSHVHTVRSMWVWDNRTTVLNAGFWSSLPLDYLLRISGRSDLQVSDARMMPSPTPGHPLEDALLVRTLRLNALTGAFSVLWGELYGEFWGDYSWAVSWEGLSPLGEGGPEWNSDSPLRSDRERRAALVEIDALVSAWLGISYDQLVAIYRARYPVLFEREANLWFDSHGRRISENSYAFGYGQTKEDYLQLQKYLETDDPADIPHGYSAPFYKADREREYREAHAYFTEIVERAKRDGTWTEPERPASATDATAPTAISAPGED
ncbi:Eco57I restriction-modification methylase domain-containing protein [Nocardiopsis flavescens]|uniref:Eco57I restriction-modification methylase domain-containing protein n=1 Tax=Nocardiopsis flavescens TaxID=758803 RepID=UPI0036547B9C